MDKKKTAEAVYRMLLEEIRKDDFRGIGRSAGSAVRNRDHQGDEEEENCESEGQPSNDFLRAAFFRLSEDVKSSAGDRAGSTFRLTALQQGQDDNDESYDNEHDVIPLHHNFFSFPLAKP